MVGHIGTRVTNKLTDLAIRSFIRRTRELPVAHAKLSDGGGLYLTVTPAGTPVWRLKYRLGGKERLYAIGTYPHITLDAARVERDSTKALIRQGYDPVVARRLKRAAAAASSGQTFSTIAADWLSRQQGTVKASYGPQHCGGVHERGLASQGGRAPRYQFG